MRNNPDHTLFDQRPVLLLTRPRDRSEAFWQSLPDELRNQMDLVISPLIGFEPCGTAPDLSGLGGVIFTSSLATSAFRSLGGTVPNGMTAYCVGDNTAKTAQKLGFRAISAGGSSPDLIQLIAAETPSLPLLHLRGTHSRGEVAKSLTELGMLTKEAVIYDQPALPLSNHAFQALSGTAPVIAPLFSPRTAALFAAGCRQESGIYLVYMSAAVAKEAIGLRVDGSLTAIVPNASAMRDAVISVAEDANLVVSGSVGRGNSV